MRRVALTSIIGTCLATSALAAPGFAVQPTGQVTGSTCQSYALGVALAFKRDPAFKLDTAADLRSAEQAIRAEIVKASGGAAVTHDHIRTGFQNYTGNRYRIKMEDVDLAALGTRISSQTGVSTAAIPLNFLLGAVVKDVALSSATRIDGDSYSAGHIFTIMGVDGGPNSNQRFLVLNSAIKVKDTERNSCSDGVPDDPGPYTAGLAWKPVNNISFRTFNGNKIRLWTVEKT